MRTLTFEATYKWKDAELYRYAYNGGDLTSAVINPCLTMKNTVLTVESPCNIEPGTIDFPWKSNLAPNVRWRIGSAPVGDDELIQPARGYGNRSRSGNGRAASYPGQRANRLCHPGGIRLSFSWASTSVCTWPTSGAATRWSRPASTPDDPKN
jgi:hypothetical protein